MKASILKMRMAVVAAFITLCAATAVAQTARKHVIERGETLESIATRYGVTTEEIIKLNPDAAQFVYVGMELTLPEKPVETAVGDTAVPEKLCQSLQRLRISTGKASILLRMVAS